MLFSWWFLVFVACYGFSGARCSHAGGNAESQWRWNGLERGHYRAEGLDLISVGLDKANNLMTSVLQAAGGTSRKEDRFVLSASAREDLEEKLKDAEEYALLLQKYAE